MSLQNAMSNLTGNSPEASTEALAERLRAAIQDRSARVGVIGLGYVGLPLVELFADKGFPVLGLDIDTVKVERLEAGQSYIGHISSKRVAALRESGRFIATTDFSRLGEADAVLSWNRNDRFSDNGYRGGDSKPCRRRGLIGIRRRDNC